MNTKTKVLMIIVASVCSLSVRSSACCTPPNVAIWTKRYWVVPGAEMSIQAYEQSYTCITGWTWMVSGGQLVDEYGCDLSCYCPSCRGYFTFNNVGYHRVDVQVTNSCASDSDYASVYAVTMGISPEPWYIPVNDDDDDGDGWMDMFNGGDLTYGGPLVQGQDDDLVQFNLSVNAPQTYYNDKVELAILTAPATLRVWADRTRTSRVLPTATGYSKKWAPGSQTTPIYMEGKSPSSGYRTSDPKSRWQYWGNDSYALTGWDPDSWITVVHVDMDLAGVKDEEYSSPDAGKTEETTPGGFIPLDDFVQLTVKPVSPNDAEDVAPEIWRDMTLDVEYGGSGRIQIWDETLYAPLTLPHPCSPTGNTIYYVEGYHASSEPCDITLVLTHVTTGFQDKIKLTVVGVDKIEYKIGLDDYQDCPSPLAVAKGADVTFRAIKKPSWAPWPAGKPVWSGSSGASGTGEEKEVAFDITSSSPTDYKVVQAECGNAVSVNVVVVDLSTLVINANRTSEPAESSFPVKPGEHFELGGTFKFDLMLNTWPTPVKLGAEVWDLDYINEVIASGPGASISHTFGTGGHDDGTCDVCFYFDNNTSGDSRTGSNDPQVDSYDFEVQELTYHYLTFGKSSAVAGTPDTSAACQGATNLILRKDTADDYRATARFLAAGLTEIPASTHDPMNMERKADGNLYDTWNHWSYFINYDSAEVIIVTDVRPCNANQQFVPPDTPGFSHTGVMYEICLEDDDVNGNILAHEAGHSCGLPHNNSHLDMVMEESTDGNETLLTQSEAAAFE
jgi:hypothetical protein